jgi:hypothetical protein
MHIHGNHMQLQAANLPTAASAQKAAAARQAADVRGRLMNSSLEMGSEVSPEANWMLGGWPQGNSGGQQSMSQDDSSVSDGAVADEAGQTEQPVSIWA